MELKKVFERKKPLISPEEQESFRELGKEMIFTEEVDLPLSKENIPAISEAMQQQFINIQTERRRRNLESINRFEARFLTSEQIEQRNKEHYIFTPSMMDLPEREFLWHLYVRFGMTSVFDQGNGYDSRGFTPKLAKYDNEENVETNCVGLTTMFGAYCKKRGLKVELGITPDHPMVIVEAEGVQYIVDGQRPPIKLHGVFDEKDGYKIYHVSPDDREGGLEDEKSGNPIDQKFIIVHDFNRAVMYEVLENISIFKSVANNEEVDLVPGSRREVYELSKKYAEVLKKGDWRSMQQKLFPEIERSFVENKDAWTEEIERMKDFRKQEKKNSLMLDLLFLAQNETHFKDKDFNESQNAIRSMSKEYKDDIKAFFIYGFEFGPDIPEDIKNFFTFLRTALQKQDLEVAKYIRDRIWNKINE